MTEIPYGYCHCGCGEKTRLSDKSAPQEGLAKGQPRKYVYGHHRRAHGPLYVLEDRGYDTPCWVWQRATHKLGYGVAAKANESGTRLAHRVVYEALVGPITEGLTLDHLCRVRCCVNPAHLEPVTHAENTRRGIQPAALKTYCVNGHEFTPENIYWRSARSTGKRQCRLCALAAQKRYRQRKKERAA